jgi:hypothetical protein
LTHFGHCTCPLVGFLCLNVTNRDGVGELIGIAAERSRKV